jgi:hypothetical protein
LVFLAEMTAAALFAGESVTAHEFAQHSRANGYDAYEVVCSQPMEYGEGYFLVPRDFAKDTFSGRPVIRPA